MLQLVRCGGTGFFAMRAVSTGSYMRSISWRARCADWAWRTRIRAEALALWLTFRALQRDGYWAGQAPGQARGRIIKVDRAIHAALGHRFHNYGAEPAPFRRSHGR